LLFLAFAVPMTSMRDMVGTAKENETLLKMQKVEQAYKSYFTLNGAWPESPEVLIENTSDGQPPLLEGGPPAITSPWGTPFEVEIQADEKGHEEVVVTTTNRDGKVLHWPRK